MKSIKFLERSIAFVVQFFAGLLEYTEIIDNIFICCYRSYLNIYTVLNLMFFCLNIFAILSVVFLM